jgi:hypothetical protein
VRAGSGWNWRGIEWATRVVDMNVGVQSVWTKNNLQERTKMNVDALGSRYGYGRFRVGMSAALRGNKGNGMQIGGGVGVEGEAEMLVLTTTRTSVAGITDRSGALVLDVFTSQTFVVWQGSPGVSPDSD